MADEGMSKDKAQALAEVVRRATPHAVEVRSEGAFFAVEVRRPMVGDWLTLRDEQDWEWLQERIRGDK